MKFETEKRKPGSLTSALGRVAKSPAVSGNSAINAQWSWCDCSITMLNSVMIEYISGMKLIKAYNMRSESFQKFSGAIHEENAMWNETFRCMGPPYASSDFSWDPGHAHTGLYE